MGEKLGSPVFHPSSGCTHFLAGEGGDFHVSSLFSTSSMEGTREDIYHCSLEGGHPSDIPLSVTWVYNLETLVYPRVGLL